MIGRSSFGVLVALALVACAGTGEQQETVPQGPPVTEGAPPEESIEPTEEPLPQVPEVAEVPEAPPFLDLLLVTGPDGEITVISPDGTVTRELRVSTGQSGPSLQPTWAPTFVDGRRLAAWSELNDDGAFAITLADIENAEIETYLSPVAPFYYYWSPDATLLAFLGQNAFSPLQMGMVDLPRDEVYAIGDGQPFYFAWRADSNAMVTHIGDAMSLLARTDGGWSSETLSLVPGLFQTPAWLPDDQIIITSPVSQGEVEVGLSGTPSAQGDRSGHRLIVSDLEGRSIRILAELEGPVSFQADPLGERVAFTASEGPLRVVDLADGADVAVSEGKVAAFQWSPEGGRLLFMEVDSQAKALVPKVWDGRETLVFPSFYPTRVFLLQYLPFWDQYSHSLTLWSPTGEAFTYPSVSPGSGQGRIMVQRLDDPGPLEVSKGVFASWSPTPSDLLVTPDP